jgi:hypothetical protein
MSEIKGPFATCPKCGWRGRQFTAFCPSCPSLVKFDHLDLEPPVSTPPETPYALRARARTPTPSKLPQQATSAGSAIGVASMAAVAAWSIEDATTRAVVTLAVAVVIYLMGRFATVVRTPHR